MTNNEILQANMLDILFENRNKAYGAYALRNEYNSRLLTALGAGIAMILLLVVISQYGNNNNNPLPPAGNGGMVFREINLPKEKPVEPEKPKEPAKPKPVEKIATVKYVSNIKIEKEVKTQMAAIDDMEGKAIGDNNTDGKKDDGTVVLNKEPEKGTGTGNTEVKQPEFTVQERSPEFPGGADALRKFLARNLVSPENLEQGEMKTVRIRFKVDKDGVVNGFEILASGGDDFDGEVVRVCRKMPRWIPAVQNGINVPVNYVLPVTFVGSE